MRILVADDDPTIQGVIKKVLEKEGFRILQAWDGLQAMELFRQEAPDIVLTDHFMPGLNGVEVCRRISQERGTRFVPVVMLTSAHESQLLSESLEAGAMEFITKPIGIDELRSRISAIAAMVALHAALAETQEHTEQEISVVKHLLDRLTNPGLSQMPETFAMETLQTRRINGDACAYTSSWSGAHLGLLCDATGHGLVAGVSTIPVVDTFLTMASRDISLASIYQSLNAKLIRMLPVGRFVCLIMLRVDPKNGVMEVLNAGMPDLLLHRKGAPDLRQFPSQNLPVGVSPLARKIHVEDVDIATGDRLFMHSDGLSDLVSEDIIADRFLDRSSEESISTINAGLKATLESALQDKEQHDDLSWALWEVPAPTTPTYRLHPLPSATSAATRLGFRQTFELDPRHQDVKGFLPDLLGFLGFRGVPAATSPLLATLLTEALVNAVDHGLLGLDSQLKHEGFEIYESARARALEGLSGERVRLAIGFHYRLEEPSHLNHIDVEIEDDGPGFDWHPWLNPREDASPLPFGRGICLLAALSSQLTYNATGNRVSFQVVVD
jgi:CheY-like chemotaxis protein/anti-sigma regulatory factor (Ser/Thr protein kinase)